MAYCTADDVRNITNLSSSDIADADITTLIGYATSELNKEIGATLTVELSNATMVKGDYDGSNAQFTLQYAPIGDYDGDGDVDASDILVWRKLTTEDHYTLWNSAITSIDDDEIGKITFASAPLLTYNYIVKYVWFPLPYDHFMIKKACAELTAYLCFLKLNLSDIDSYRLGKLEVKRVARHPGLVSFYDRYQNTLSKIRGKTIFRPVKWEMVHKMAAELVENILPTTAELQPGESP